MRNLGVVSVLHQKPDIVLNLAAHAKRGCAIHFAWRHGHDQKNKYLMGMRNTAVPCGILRDMLCEASVSSKIPPRDWLKRTVPSCS